MKIVYTKLGVLNNFLPHLHARRLSIAFTINPRSTPVTMTSPSDKRKSGAGSASVSHEVTRRQSPRKHMGSAPVLSAAYLQRHSSKVR